MCPCPAVPPLAPSPSTSSSLRASEETPCNPSRRSTTPSSGPNNTQITSRNSDPALWSPPSPEPTRPTTHFCASALTSALPANTTTNYTINEYLHPPAAASSPTDPSVLAFANYAEFLAQSIASAALPAKSKSGMSRCGRPIPGTTGQLLRHLSRSHPPGPAGAGIANYGFAAALQAQASPVAGVTYIWAGTSKSGDNSLLGPAMLANTGVSFSEPASPVASESFHPYGNNPEDRFGANHVSSPPSTTSPRPRSTSPSAISITPAPATF